jgi:hypothetical protein
VLSLHVLASIHESELRGCEGGVTRLNPDRAGRGEAGSGAVGGWVFHYTQRHLSMAVTAASTMDSDVTRRGGVAQR